MIIKYKYILLTTLLTVFLLNSTYAQDENGETNKKLYKKIEFYDLRGTNAADMAIGTALITGDFPQPELGIYFRLGYKRHVTEHFGISLTFNRYNLAFDETFHEGFMSFDLNLEYLINPYHNISPFIYGGYGYNADTSFETTAAKAQGGLGIEFIVLEKFGVKLFGEYNYVFSDESNPIIQAESNIGFIRMGLGLNFYFGGNKRKQKLLDSIETIINSNLIK
ncbi:outer membrane beta-barrel protein [Winogradskyella sp. WHY3]|uniref:Outer membrane beta-barrel protein n=1 Tax=Winogradskyella luteola TaxID=2828330 RepID=A0A9X1F8L6_9FLAO|nr:outer membrane beta-barrel protein [Winogradskyella luteola]